MKRNDEEKLKENTLNEITRTGAGNDGSASIELPMYATNMNITAKAYRFSSQFTELEENFEELCKEFLSSTDPDKYNSDYMDAVIEETAFDAIRNVEVQRHDHERLIYDELDPMHQGDYSYAKSMLKNFLEDREEILKELAKWKRVLYKGTAFEKEV